MEERRKKMKIRRRVLIELSSSFLQNRKMREIIDEIQELAVEQAGFGGNENDPWSLEHSLRIAKRLCFLKNKRPKLNTHST